MRAEQIRPELGSQVRVVDFCFADQSYNSCKLIQLKQLHLSNLRQQVVVHNKRQLLTGNFFMLEPLYLFLQVYVVLLFLFVVLEECLESTKAYCDTALDLVFQFLR